jgi:uncharacterized membrane protein YiaA
MKNTYWIALMMIGIFHTLSAQTTSEKVSENNGIK